MSFSRLSYLSLLFGCLLAAHMALAASRTVVANSGSSNVDGNKHGKVPWGGPKHINHKIIGESTNGVVLAEVTGPDWKQIESFLSDQKGNAGGCEKTACRKANCRVEMCIDENLEPNWGGGFVGAWSQHSLGAGTNFLQIFYPTTPNEAVIPAEKPWKGGDRPTFTCDNPQGFKDSATGKPVVLANRKARLYIDRFRCTQEMAGQSSFTIEHSEKDGSLNRFRAECYVQSKDVECE